MNESILDAHQRSRDHGLRGYNDYREECGLPRACSWDEPPEEVDPATWRELSRLYNHPNDVEPFPGGLAERTLDDDAVVGPTFACILGRQFKRLRYGDRFFFTHRGEAGSFSEAELEAVRRNRLGDVICRNVPVSALGENVFKSVSRTFSLSLYRFTQR